MTEDLEAESPEKNESTEQSQEPSPSKFIQPQPIQQLRFTWEMLVKCKKAMLENKWSGEDATAISIGIQCISQMEAQQRVQWEMAEKAARGEKNGQPAVVN